MRAAHCRAAGLLVAMGGTLAAAAAAAAVAGRRLPVPGHPKPKTDPPP